MFVAMRHTIILVLFFLSSLTQSHAAEPSPRDPSWAVPLTLDHSQNFFEVVPGVLYRASQPEAEAFKDYESIGIRTVINLRALYDDTQPAEGTSLILRRVPMNGWDITDQHVVQTLAIIRTAQRPVLVHCQNGADRTGLIIAMYRILEQNWSKEQALAEMQNGGFGFKASLWKNIPTYLRKANIETIRANVAKHAALEQ